MSTGLLDGDGSPTDKVLDAHLYITDHKLHLLAISECDFFDVCYSTNHKKFTRQSIEDALHLQGYDVWFPKTWSKYGFSRIILMVKTDSKIFV